VEIELALLDSDLEPADARDTVLGLILQDTSTRALASLSEPEDGAVEAEVEAEAEVFSSRIDGQAPPLDIYQSPHLPKLRWKTWR
jgi:hypothetical protein